MDIKIKPYMKTQSRDEPKSEVQMVKISTLVLAVERANSLHLIRVFTLREKDTFEL